MVESIQVKTLSNAQSDSGSTSTVETVSSNTKDSDFASLKLSASVITERKLSPKCKDALLVLLTLIAFATIAGLLLALNAEDSGKYSQSFYFYLPLEENAKKTLLPL